MSKLKHIKFKDESGDIKPRVTNYWTDRADTFFVQRQRELDSPKAHKWLGEIKKKIGTKKPLKILDVRCGAGYFIILLGLEGHDVTGIDLTGAMVDRARKMIEMNEPYDGDLQAIVMDAENLDFSDESFDVIITRNLTWTLPHPIKAYSEWYRVLKKGGMLLNFDAEYAKGAHNLKNQDNLAHKCISDEMKEECHKIYHMLTISTLDRPQWDVNMLYQIGFESVDVDCEFGDRMFDVKDEFYIPDRMFMISAKK
jgi:ubiquinone/menaquinone biosynthesis C-methylase UbiE